MVKFLSFRFQQCLGWSALSLVQGHYETRLFRQLSNHILRSLYFPKYMSYEGRLLFENFQNFIYISKMKKNVRKKKNSLLDNCI